MSQALSNPVVLILGSLFVVGVIAIVLNFFISMFGNTTYKTRLADIKKIRDDAQRENASLDDISEDQRLRREVKIDQRFARSLDALEQNKVVLDKTARWALAASGTAGLIVFFLYYFDVLKRMWESSSLLMIATAYAQSGASKNEIRGVLPVIVMILFVVMAGSFLIALVTLMVVKDTKENQARIKGADNIVKTFGGFFTGLATTLLREQA